MATLKKLSNFTGEALRTLPSSFASSIQQITNGTSPHVGLNENDIENGAVLKIDKEKNKEAIKKFLND